MELLKRACNFIKTELKYFVPFFFLLVNVAVSYGQNHKARFESIDVQHYVFEIHLSDSTNRIEGTTTVQIKFLKPVRKVILDLVGINDSTNTGMQVSNIIHNGSPLQFFHQNNQLEIEFETAIPADSTIEFEISCSGVPADGLIISRSKFGDRTFFGDNWPDRARHWLPTVDHPSDKATLEFRVYAPEKYKVVSNGFQQEESNLEKGMKYTVWKESVPISTKIMVIGVARFAVLNDENFKMIPVSSWVFPQNREEGFSDYSVSYKPLNYFSKIIGPYSYEKMANVQSKTRYGGMENAGCIFYAENSVTGKNKAESLIAHETSHQWFGNSVTEQNWHHIWLSEGFATYLTHLYNEYYFGENLFRQGLEKDRERVIRFANRKLAPIIDTTIVNYNQLLNTNTYQKASWFLHMLREKVGYSIFISSLQEYYRIYRNSTVLTKDFQHVIEKFSGQDLDSFFNLWLYQSGFPRIKTDWKQKKNFSLEMEIEQVQGNYLFDFPLEIEIWFENGLSEIHTLQINQKKTEFSFPLNGKIREIKLDPGVKLLFEKIL